MKGSFLGEFEEVVLLATSVLGNEAYANTVRSEVEKHTQREINLSAIHSALYRMERKGFLDSELGAASAKRGGKRKRHFYVSTKGMEALNEARRIRESFWALIPSTSIKGSTT